MPLVLPLLTDVTLAVLLVVCTRNESLTAADVAFSEGLDERTYTPLYDDLDVVPVPASQQYAQEMM